MGMKSWWRKKLGQAPTREDFAAEVLEAAAARGLKGVYDPEAFAIRFGDEALSDLHNLYSDVCRQPARQAELTARFLASFEEIGFLSRLSREEALKRLMPVVRFPYREPLPPGHRYEEHAPLSFAGVAALQVVLDGKDSIRHIDQETLDGWGLGLMEAFNLAIDNLAASTQPKWHQLRPGLWRSAWDDDYDSSRILLPNSWSNLPIRGSAVAMAPARGCLLIADDADPEALGELARVGEKVFAEDARRVTAVPVRLGEKGWELFDSPGDHPGEIALANLKRTGLGTLYAAQREKLQEGRDDYFVASLSGYHREADGRLVTFCTWSSTIVSLLPVADEIHFVDSDLQKVVASCSWTRFAEVAGDAWERLEMVPVRYQTPTTLPDRDLLASLDERKEP